MRGYVPIGNSGIITVGYALLYGGETYCYYTGIGDNETFDNSRLTAKFSVSGMRRSAQALRCPQSLRAGAFVQCGGTKRSAAAEKPPQGRHFHLAGVIMLLDVGGAATEEQGQME